jgi:hypothetical protein
MTSRPTPPAGDVPARRASYATSCTAICVVGSVSRRSWSASLITRRLGMPPPHESHHLPAAVIAVVVGTQGGQVRPASLTQQVVEPYDHGQAEHGQRQQPPDQRARPSLRPVESGRGGHRHHRRGIQPTSGNVVPSEQVAHPPVSPSPVPRTLRTAIPPPPTPKGATRRPRWAAGRIRQGQIRRCDRMGPRPVGRRVSRCPHSEL